MLHDGFLSVADTLGGPGVTHVFTHCAMSFHDRPQLPGIERFSERALLLAREGDVVCVPHPVDEEHLAFLRKFGFGPRAENIVAPRHDPAHAGGWSLLEALLATDEAVARIVKLTTGSPAVVLNAFVGSRKEFALAELLRQRLGKNVAVVGGDPVLVDIVNHKHVLRARALDLGVPVARGEVIHLPAERQSAEAVKALCAAARRQCRRTGQVLIRGSWGASGTATLILGSSTSTFRSPGGPNATEAEFTDALEDFIRRDFNRVYLVDEMHDVAVSPNVLMYIEPVGGAISCVGVTDQRLDARLAWRGNAFPTAGRTAGAMYESAYRLCDWLRLKGYSGFAGFDFVEYLDPDTGQLGFFLAELNARVNGVTYPLALMQRLNEGQNREGKPPIRAFVSGSHRTAARSFLELEKVYGQLFFDRDHGSGVFPYNMGCLAAEWFHYALFGGSMAEVLELEAELEPH